MGIFMTKVAGDISILDKKSASVFKDNISSGEKVLFCLKDSKQTLIALAHRICIIKTYWFQEYGFSSFFYRDITSVEVVRGMFLSSLRIYTPIDDTQKRDSLLLLIPGVSGTATLHNHFFFENRHLKTFLPYVERIKALIQEHSKHNESNNQKSDNSEATKFNIAEQIEKLSNLRQSGALTEEEYLQAKKKILEK